MTQTPIGKRVNIPLLLRVNTLTDMKARELKARPDNLRKRALLRALMQRLEVADQENIETNKDSSRKKQAMEYQAIESAAEGTAFNFDRLYID